MNKKKHMSFMRFKNLIFHLLFISAIGLSGGCVRERDPITGKARAYGSSWQQELKMGQEANQQIIQQYGLYPDPKLQAYVQQVGLRVLGESDLRQADTPAMYRQTPIQFQVLDSPVVNAFAIPGYIYVTRGLLSHMQNEAQLAVVLGHEIAHIAARHISEQTLKEQWSQLGLFAGAIVGSQVLKSPEAANQLLKLGSAATQLVGRKFSRDDEREADRLGVKYAASEGYRVSEGAAFFSTLDRLQSRESVTMPSWLSTHPDPGEREKTLVQLGRQYQPSGAMQVIGEDMLLRNLEGIVVGENPREGFVQGNTFYHPEFAFQFPVPQGWQVKNERAAVMMAPQQASALIAFTLYPGRSAQQAAAEFVQSQKINVVRNATTQVNGFPAYVVLGQGTTRQGEVGLLNYFIESSDRVFHFLGVAPAAQFAAVQNTFQQTMNGFSRLTDPRFLNVEPARLAVITTDRPGTLASFIPTSRIAGLTPEELAIMNHVQLNATIPAGTKLKVPRLPATP